ncbi:MAG: hypothetical protein LBC53_10855 [Spirochaetaceae bacterium]|jgi:hypothetical protein|nr:hypothetical protein [Spirochaetaceae bacterium]
MKQKILALVFLAAFSIQSFAQEETKNAVFVDFGPTVLGAIAGGFGIGLGYERALTSKFSALGNFSVIGFNIEQNKYFGLAIGVHGRFYPISGGTAVKKFYIDLGGTYSNINMEYSGDKAASNIIEAGVMLGWKFVLGNASSGLFLEPTAGWGFVFGEVKVPSGMRPIPVNGGAKFGVNIGYAF